MLSVSAIAAVYSDHRCSPFTSIPREFPLLERITLAREHAAQLFRAAHVEPELEHMDTVLHQHLLEGLDLLEELRVLFRRAKAEYRLDHAAVVPGAVKEHHLTCAWQMLDIALEIPLALLLFGGFGQGHHMRGTAG